MSLNQTTDNELSIKKILKIEVGKLNNNNVPQTFNEEKELLKIKNKKYENSLKNYFKLKKFNFKCKTWNDRCKLICKKIIINTMYSIIINNVFGKDFNFWNTFFFINNNRIIFNYK